MAIHDPVQSTDTPAPASRGVRSVLLSCAEAPGRAKDLGVGGRIDIVEVCKTDIVEISRDFRGDIAIQGQRRSARHDECEQMSNAAARDGATTALAVRFVG